jgi:hypothetical protein
MQLEIKNIKTGEITFACLNYLSKKEIKNFIAFYNSIKCLGSKKYNVKKINS